MDKNFIRVSETDLIAVRRIVRVRFFPNYIAYLVNGKFRYDTYFDEDYSKDVKELNIPILEIQYSAEDGAVDFVRIKGAKAVAMWEYLKADSYLRDIVMMYDFEGGPDWGQEEDYTAYIVKE